jgi:Asp/Glu/hydantoin racemase
MRWLLLNPNTSPAVTARLLAHAQAELQARGRADVALQACTATLGASYIATEASYALAAHGALDAWAQALAPHHLASPTDTSGPGPAATPQPFDAILLGCFGDPGVWALREASGLPVVGLAEAAMVQAARHGRFAIVTGGAAWAPMLQRLAAQLGLAEALAAVHTVAPSGAELAAQPEAALKLLGQACEQAAQGVDAVVLGGAGLAGMAAPLAGRLAVPLIDSASAGVVALLDEAPERWSAPPAPGAAPVWTGLTHALSQQLR